MLAFPPMLVAHAEKAGMKVPESLNEYDPSEYPHWEVFLTCQMGRACPTPEAPWNNAKLIAGIRDDKIKVITAQEIVDLGFEEGFNF